MDSQIEIALEEDIAELGDVTGNAIFANEQDNFSLICKATGIICGVETAQKVLTCVDPSINSEFLVRDGDAVKNGMPVARISGTVRTILTAERVLLNFLSHLSGIATKTRQYADAAAPAKILDTRKTIPGLRTLQKHAVAVGGGSNHRMGLFDMVLIKDNHIDAAGTMARAVERVRRTWGTRFPVEVETRNLDEVVQALACKVDRIMLDNMDNETMTEAVKMTGASAETEASGNITLERLPSVAATGVDFISVGSLTHSVEALDFSLVKEN